jgi:hypothetical protein
MIVSISWPMVTPIRLLLQHSTVCTYIQMNQCLSMIGSILLALTLWDGK